MRAVLRETEDQAFDRACCNQSKTLCNATFIQALVAIHKQLDVPRLKLEGKFTKLPEIDKLGPKSRAVTEGTALFGLRSERVKLHCLDFLGNS